MEDAGRLPDIEALRPHLRRALAEDLGDGDRTSVWAVPDGARGRARLLAKAPGVLAGWAVFWETLHLAGARPGELRQARRDAEPVEPGDVVAEFAGDARGLLAGERTALNFLQRLSGTATLTAQLVQAVAGTGARILDTRKTTPGWRSLQKYAVRAGGGTNHREALYDAVLLKENHLTFGGRLDAVAARAREAGIPFMVEAESLGEFQTAMEAGADVVLLDDFTPASVREAVALRGDRTRPWIEVSGGVTLQDVRTYAAAGAERISVGALTHSAPALDLSLRIEPA